jgi:heptosyltransferase-1
VIHHLPALTEARRHLPDARFSWVVEEDFAPLVRLHPAVDEVMTVATRRWRKAPLSAATWREIAAASRAIRAHRYDAIIDTQGLLRSALIARRARGRRHGYDRSSIRERLAASFYDVRHTVARQAHAIERNRMLTGLALGYAPAGAIDFGLARETLADAGDYGILLHATARPEKEWPAESWIELGQNLGGRGFPLALPYGSMAERRRSETIAALVPGARVPERQPLDGIARLVAGAAFVVGVDTGLMHLAAALGVPLVAIFVGSKPDLTGPRGAGPIAIAGSARESPSVAAVLAAVDRILP